MKRYTIRDVSEELGIPKYTLRYYDKVNLVCPSRGENKYRYYTERDVLDLRYIEVMKYAGFALHEIRQVILNKQKSDENSLSNTAALFTDKKFELEQKIDLYRSMVKLVKEAQRILEAKERPEDVSRMNNMITALFQKLRNDTI